MVNQLATWLFIWVADKWFMHQGQARPFELTTCAKPIGNKGSMVPEEFNLTS